METRMAKVPKTEVISVRITKEVKATLVDVAEKQDWTISQIAGRLLTEAVVKHGLKVS